MSSPTIEHDSLGATARVHGVEAMTCQAAVVATFVPAFIEVRVTFSAQGPITRVEVWGRKERGRREGAVFLSTPTSTSGFAELGTAPAWVQEYADSVIRGLSTEIEYAVQSRTRLDGAYDRLYNSDPRTLRPYTLAGAQEEVAAITGPRGQYAATRFDDGQPGARVVARGHTEWAPTPVPHS